MTEKRGSRINERDESRQRIVAAAVIYADDFETSIRELIQNAAQTLVKRLHRLLFVIEGRDDRNEFTGRVVVQRLVGPIISFFTRFCAGIASSLLTPPRRAQKRSLFQLTLCLRAHVVMRG